MLCAFQHEATNELKVKGQKKINYANNKGKKSGVAIYTQVKTDFIPKKYCHN